MEKTKKIATVVFCILAVLFLFKGAAISAEINIGYSGPLTGPAAYIGVDALHGIEIAVKELNDAGGVEVAGKKYNVKLRTYDDEGVAAKAVAGMQKLKDRYEIPVLIQNISPSVMGCLERNEKLNVLIIGFFSIPAATTKGNKLILRHRDTGRDESIFIAKATAKHFKPKTYAMISDVGDYGKAIEAVYKETYEKLGVKLVANEWLDMRTQTDFRGQLTKIRATNPDVIMLAAYDEASAGVIKQAHELGMKTPFVLSSGFTQKGENLAGPALLEGYLKILEYFARTPFPPAVERYYTKLYPAMNYKEVASPFGLAAYAIVHSMARAMQKAGTTTDAWKIRQAAPQVVPLDDQHNTHGLIAWKENGDGVKLNTIGQYRNGKLVVLDVGIKY